MASIQGIYVTLFGRPADPAGLAYFEGVTKGGTDLSAIGDLASTDEYQGRFPNMNNTQIVTAIYQALFGRDPDQAGLSFFVDLLNKGTQTINTIAINIMDGATGGDKAIIDAKIEAADKFTAALNDPLKVAAYSGDAGVKLGVDFLSGITSEDDIPSDEAIAKSIEDFVSEGNVGNTVTLTAAAVTVGEVAVGSTHSSAKDDTINAADGVWTADNKIDGGFGTDTLKAVLDADLEVNGTGKEGNVKSIEKLVVASSDAVELNLTALKGVQSVTVDGGVATAPTAGTAAITVSGITLATTVGVAGKVAGAVEFAFTDAKGTSDVLTLNTDTVAAGTNGGITVSAVETLNIANTGASTLGLVSAEDAKAISLAGAGTLGLSIGATAEGATVTNKATAAVTVDLTKADNVVSYTGGEKADTVTVDASHTANQTISTGAGSDVITVKALASGDEASDFTLTLSGGAGSDRFVFEKAGNVVDVADVSKSLITVTDFAKAEDVIDLKGIAQSAAITDNVILTDIKNGTLAEALELVAANTAKGQALTFINGSDAYIYIDSDASADADVTKAALTAGDTLIKVTGVTTLDDFNSSNLHFLAS